MSAHFKPNKIKKPATIKVTGYYGAQSRGQIKNPPNPYTYYVSHSVWVSSWVTNFLIFLAAITINHLIKHLIIVLISFLINIPNILRFQLNLYLSCFYLYYSIATIIKIFHDMAGNYYCTIAFFFLLNYFYKIIS